MKTRFLICLFTLLLLWGCSSKNESPPISLEVDPDFYYEITPDLKARYIQEGVFVITHTFPWAASSLAVVMGDHLILVDTPWTPEATQEMLDWLSTQVGAKDILAINTHFHLDNLGGNAYLIEKDIPIYGSDFTVDLLDARGQASLDQTIAWLEKEEDPRFASAFQNINLIPPTEIFPLQDGLNLKLAGETIQIYYPGPGHSPDNLVVYFPERKLLFGDV